MNKIHALLLFATAVVLAGCGTTSSLQLNPAEGTTYRYVSKVNSDIDMQSIAIESKVEYYYSLTVEKKLDTAFVFNMTYDSLKMDIVNPMTGTVNYNSNNPDVGSDPTVKQIHEMYEELERAKISIWVDERGNVLKTEGLDAVASESNQMLQAGNMTGGAGARMSFVGFPDTEIEEGLVFSDETSIGNTAEGITTNFTVRDAGKREVVLDLKLDTVKDEAFEMGGVQARLKDMRGSGEATVSRNSGMVKQRSLTQESNMEMDVQGMTMEMISKTVTTISLLD